MSEKPSFSRGSVCAVYGCNNYKQQKNPKSFFRMPKDLERLKKWIVACKRTDLDNLMKTKNADYFYNSYVVCSDHFDVECFRNKDLYSQGLMPGSVPTLKLYNNKNTMKRRCPRQINLDCPLSAKQIKLNSEDTIMETEEQDENIIPDVANLQAEIANLHSVIENYKKKLNNYSSLLSKYKKKCKSLTESLSVSKNKESTSQPNTMNKVCKQFIESQQKLSSRHKLGRRYEIADKEFALALYYCSTKSYILLQKYFCLPSLSSLRSWLNNLQVSCGLNNTVLELLKLKAQRITLKERVITLVFDEMSLKENLIYDARRDVFEGFQDFGDHNPESLQLCNQAMVFMIKGVYIDFKQVIGYYLSKDALSADIMYKLFLDILEKICSTGFIIKAVICDMGSNNVKLRKLLSVSITKPYIEFKGNKIYFLYDSPHLLKCVRNNFKNFDFQYKNSTASWSHVVDFYNIDSKQLPRSAPKLNIKCITLPPFSPMRVCLASRVFSHSVSVGILCKVTLNDLPANATFTADFIDKIDTLFDIFNSSKYKEKKKFRRPISLNSAHINKLNELSDFLKEIIVLNKRKLNPLCINGWLINIEVLKMLWQDLKDNFDFKFLFTRRLTQDCIENLFSIIRYKGGNNVTPDSSMFRCSLRSVMANQLLQPSSDSNSEVDACEFLLQREQIMQKNISVTVSTYNQTQAHYSVSISEKNSEYYVLGWVCSSLPHDKCKKLVCSLDNDYSLENTQIELKKYDNSSRLFFPNENAKRVSDIINKVFKENIDSFLKISVNNVKARLITSVYPQINISMCDECIKLFLDKYFNVLLKAYVNKFNDSRESRCKSRNLKLKKISHS